MLHFPFGKPKTRRLKTLAISGDTFLRILQALDGETIYRQAGIPEDARTVGLRIDAAFSRIDIYVESAEFPEVGEAIEPPSFTPTFSSYTPPLPPPPAWPEDRVVP